MHVRNIAGNIPYHHRNIVLFKIWYNILPISSILFFFNFFFVFIINLHLRRAVDTTLRSKKNNEELERCRRVVHDANASYFGSEMFRASTLTPRRLLLTDVGGRPFIQNNYSRDTRRRGPRYLGRMNARYFGRTNAERFDFNK